MANGITVELVRKMLEQICPRLSESYSITRYGLPEEGKVRLGRGDSEIICSGVEGGLVFAVTPRINGRGLVEIIGGESNTKGSYSLIDALRVAEYALYAGQSQFMFNEFLHAVGKLR